MASEIRSRAVRYAMRPYGPAPATTTLDECLTTDGKFLYIFNDRGLFQVGTGFRDTLRGHIYRQLHGWRFKERQTELACVGEYLVFASSSKPGVATVLLASSLEELGSFEVVTLRDGSAPLVGTPSTRMRLTSEGKYLYAVFESNVILENGSSVKKYFVYLFDLIPLASGGIGGQYIRHFELLPFNLPLPVVASPAIPPPPPPPGTDVVAEISLPAEEPNLPPAIPVAIARHEGVTCNGCHRMSFHLKRFRCKSINLFFIFFFFFKLFFPIACSGFNLCQWCYYSDNNGNNSSFPGHK
jgi:hypothetical protein